MGLFDRLRTSGPDALTRAAVARIRALPDVADARALDGDTIAVTFAAGGAEQQVDLGGIRPDWKAAGGFDRIEIMDAFVQAMAAPATTLPAGQDLVADVVVEGWADVVDRITIRVHAPGQVPRGALAWPVGDVLHAVAIVLPRPGAATPPIPVTQHDAERWGVAPAAVAEAMGAGLDREPPVLEPIEAGVAAWVAAGDPHPARWLLRPDRLVAAVGADPLVALVPTATELVVVDANATALLDDVLRHTATILDAETDVLWPAPFLLRPGAATPWQPGDGHPCDPAVRALRSRLG